MRGVSMVANPGTTDPAGTGVEVSNMNRRKDPVAFFYEHTGWSYDPKTQTEEEGRQETARSLAAAEAWANDNNVRFSWDHEAYPDYSGIEHRSPLWTCIAFDDEGEPVASLGNIDLGADADPWMHGIPGGGALYARVIEAELACEVMNRGQP